MNESLHKSKDELEAGLDEILRAPRDVGTVRMLVRRPKSNARDVVDAVDLSTRFGVVGDCWGDGLPANADESDDQSEPFENQVTLMNARAAALVTGSRERWPLAGDQIYVDFSLSVDDLPAGTLLEVGGAVMRVSAVPHTGCSKFRARFGSDALKFVNSPEGRRLNLRGINARVMRAGTVRVGDVIRRQPVVDDERGHRPLPSPLNRPLRLAALISGGGTTLMNFVAQRDTGRLNIAIPLVVASRASCGGVARARAAGLRVEVLSPKKFDGAEAYGRELFGLLDSVGVDLAAMAGFLSLVQIPDAWRHRVMNIHPGLIPSFCGKGFYGHHVHEAVLERGAKVSGCTIHFADNEYDHGPILVQRCVPVLDDDTPDTLAARVFAAECEAYPEAIRLFATGRLEVRGRRVSLAPG